MRFLVSAALIFALFKFVPYSELVHIFRGSQKYYIVSAFFLFAATIFLGVWRWWVLLRSFEILVSFRELVYSFFSGLFLNLFFPSFVAGDVFRIAAVRRHGDTKKIASTVFMDRFSGVVALVTVAVIAFWAGGSLFATDQISPSLVVFCGITILFSLFIFSRRVFLFFLKVIPDRLSLKKKIIELHDHIYIFKERPVVFIQTLLISAAIHLLTAFSFYFSALAFGSKLGVVYFLMLVPVIMVFATIPITIAGSGTREAASVFFFGLAGMAKGIALSISLLNLIFIIVSGIAGGIIYVAIYHRWLQSPA